MWAVLSCNLSVVINLAIPGSVFSITTKCSAALTTWFIAFPWQLVHLKSGPRPNLCYLSLPSRPPCRLYGSGEQRHHLKSTGGRIFPRTVRISYFSFLVTAASLCRSVFSSSIRWHNCTSTTSPQPSDVIHEHLASTSSSTLASNHPPGRAYWASWAQPPNALSPHSAETWLTSNRNTASSSQTSVIQWYGVILVNRSACSGLAGMWLHLSTPRLASGCNNGIILWSYSRSVRSQPSTPRPCPITATLSMWCELINITDAAQATRHEG